MTWSVDVRIPPTTTGMASGNLDPAEDLALGQAHPAGGLDQVAIDLAEPGVGADQDRGDRQGRHRHERGDQPEAELGAQRERDRQDDAHEGVGRDRPTDVGHVDRGRGAPPGVADPEPDGEPDQDRDEDGRAGHREVLQHPDRDPVRALPVGRVEEPADDIRHQAADRARAHGVRRRSTRTSSTSARTANATVSAAPR